MSNAVPPPSHFSPPTSPSTSLHDISQCDPGAVLVSFLAGCISVAFLSHFSVGFLSQAPKSNKHWSYCLSWGLILAAVTVTNQATSMRSSTLTFRGLCQTKTTHKEKRGVSIHGCAVDVPPYNQPACQNVGAHTVCSQSSSCVASFLLIWASIVHYWHSVSCPSRVTVSEWLLSY